MTDMIAAPQERPPLWRDVRVLRVVGQIVFAVLAVGFLWYIAGNLTTNMSRLGLQTNFDYLTQPGGVQIAGTDTTSTTPIWQLILIGVKNTALVAFLGIFLATILGVLLGIARLSTNWIVRKGAALYVETVRNIPVLVLIIFFAIAIILRLPAISDPIEVGNAFILSNAGVWIPWFELPEGGGLLLIVLALVALAIAVGVAVWRTRLNERTGVPHHRIVWGLGTFLVLAAIGFVIAGVPVEGTSPTRDGFRVSGGFRFLAQYLGLLLGLVIYTASHIAEIVRGSIQAVPKGQYEAAEAIALSSFQRMRYIILPQALRIMVPPLANQYLNLTKNSSLAIAVGYPDVVAVILQIIGNGRPAPQGVAIMMLVFLVFSLSISALTNLYNRRIQYVGR